MNLSFADFTAVSRPRPAAASGRRGGAAAGGRAGGRAAAAVQGGGRSGAARPQSHRRQPARRPSHIPYRDSKLTRLVAHAFSGGGVALVHARADRFEEAEAALAFGRKLAELPAAAARGGRRRAREARAAAEAEVVGLCEKLGLKREAVAGAASVRLDDKSTDDELKLHDAAALLERLDLRLGAWETLRDGPPARPPLSENAAAAAPQLRLLKAKAKA